MTAAQRRYVLATDKDTAAGLIWSTGDAWSASADFSRSLMTGPEADAMATRHPGAVVVDWPVHKAICDVFHAAFMAKLNELRAGGRRTPAIATEAREAGRKALRAAGYVNAAAKDMPCNPCEGLPT